VIEPRLVDDVEHRAAGAGLGVERAVDQSRHAGQDDRADARTEYRAGVSIRSEVAS
jgi:hypothetical protein